jgi:hypothetical protein
MNALFSSLPFRRRAPIPTFPRKGKEQDHERT